MNFFYCFFALFFIVLNNSATDTNTELVYPECGLIRPSHASIGLVFFVIINNTSERNDYDVEITPDECCLEGDIVDCDSLQIIGGCKDFVPRGETKLVKAVAPILNQFDRKGNCALYVDSKSSIGHNRRDTININFNTRSYINAFDNYKDCEHEDEDPFNDCKPVNCDAYYNGAKPHFSRRLKRCVAAPSCVKEDDYDYPSVIYNPQTNQCIDETIVDSDLEHIKILNKDQSKKRKPKEILIIKKFQPNETFFITNDILIDDIVTTTTKKQEITTINELAVLNLKAKQESFVSSCSEADSFPSFLKKYFGDSNWTLLILVLVIVAQCLLICTMIYYLSRSCYCFKEKKVIRKFFNYRQDVSVTTPLIHTSNIDTETTDFQYATESSNIDQKIKCYKACQKEKTNVKKSMSDDILTKLLNRRDWKKTKSQAKPEPGTKTEETHKLVSESNQDNNQPKHDGKIINETKVIYEDEKENKITNKKQTKFVNAENNTDDGRKEDQGIEVNLSSEKEIKCHSYNRFDTGVAEYRANLALNAGIFKHDKSRNDTPNSSEKGAQAYFSNDSIDDLLSERGVIYLAGENMSKYTFSNGSNELKPSTTSASSKTSKNFVKNVLSLLNKRSKQGPSSDPGRNKDIDLEILHMSRASAYSSTNDSDCVKNIKRKDSRTSY